MVRESKAEGKRKKELVDTFKKRFERTLGYEGVARKRFLQDMKFAEGDSENNWQWDQDLYTGRTQDDKPCLTINKTRQHNLQILNDMKQNRPGLKARPTGGEASYLAAQVIDCLLKRIMDQSDEAVVQNVVARQQVLGGIGWYRVVTEYVGNGNWDQDIYVRAIEDSLMVLCDPDAKLPDKSDAKFIILFSKIPETEFEDIYPGFSEELRSAGDWKTSEGGEDSVQIAEYFYLTKRENELISWVDEDTGETKQAIVGPEGMPREMLERVIDNPATRNRVVYENEVHRAVICNNTILEEAVLPGTMIPLVPQIGEEVVLDGQLDRKGHTRALIDPQRMYNYWSSGSVEYGALQTKTPWIAPVEAIEGNEDQWNNQNVNNQSVLLYRQFNEDGTAIRRPEKLPPPQAAQLFLEGMQVAQTEMMLVSGQYGSQMGQTSNERSGKAIQQRQRQGDNATYHFIDGQNVAYRRLGKIILDLIPKIYDTQRVIYAMAHDDQNIIVNIDPEQKTALAMGAAQDRASASFIFNPKVGLYDVVIDTGPGYQTRREEATDALGALIQQVPAAAGILGDIYVKNFSFEGANEAAARLRRMIPPQALGTGPTQAEQQLMQQLQAAQGQINDLFGQLQEQKLKLTGKTEMRDIDLFDAETKRLGVVKDLLPLDPAGLNALITDTVNQALATSLSPLLADLKTSLGGLGTSPLSQGPAAQALMGQGQAPMPGPQPQGVPQA